MHCIKFIRENAETFREAMRKRGVECDVDEILYLDSSVRRHKTELDDLSHAKKILDRRIFAQKKGEGGDLDELLAECELFKGKAEIIEEKMKADSDQLRNKLVALPNMADSEVPYGISESDNVEIKRFDGIKQSDSMKYYQHFEIPSVKKSMDFTTAGKMSGSRFVILRERLATLERALANFMLDLHVKDYNYVEVSPPLLVKDHAMFGTGQLPKFAGDSFVVDNGNYRLVPTGEVPLVNMVADQIVQRGDLPMRFVAYTLCFRSEAGSAGRDTRGMIRLHQFSKVELVTICAEDNSEKEHQQMLNAAERVLQELNISYRVMLLSSQDMGFSAKKTYDIEVWMPSRNKFVEIASCSNCGDFQARRMAARYKNASGRNCFVHTLNGSALAVGRTLAALLENYQDDQGRVLIPEVLKKYLPLGDSDYIFA